MTESHFPLSGSVTGPGGWKGDQGQVRRRLEREYGRDERSGLGIHFKGQETGLSLVGTISGKLQEAET